MLHGRVIAPALVVIGAGAVLLGACALPVVPAYGVVEIVAGVSALFAGRAAWRADERARRNGWPE